MNIRKYVLHLSLTVAILSIGMACSKRTISPQGIYEDAFENEVSPNKDTIAFSTLPYLALGDSYTVGASVSPSAKFPSQLSAFLEKELDVNVNLELIATSGWRTDNLLSALENVNTDRTYGLVTLLIGVNNQYQGIPFSKYEIEFTELFERALALADGNRERLIIISIPDWGYTPFGEGFDREQISSEIDRYNDFAERKAAKFDVTFIYITDTTRRGLAEKELVASDNLHPSAMAYKLFIDRMAPTIISQLKN